MPFLRGSERTRIREINPAAFNLIFGFFNYFRNILPIRLIDHVFIPLFFHWSGRYKKTQLLQDGFISDFETSGSHQDRTLFEVDAKWSCLLSTHEFDKSPVAPGI
jgi:hypothetical protein